VFAETFAKQGCLVVDRLFDPRLIEAAHDEYARQYSAFDPANLPLHLEVGDKRLHLPLQLRGPLLNPEIYAHPILITILADILKTAFLIDSVNCVTALPGAAAQRFHRDHPSLFDEQDGLAATLPAYAVTVAIPLMDLTPETGTTELFAGSVGSAGSVEGPETYVEAIRPFVARGGCFLMDYRLWHRGMANRSERDRPILYMTYAREWFTDVANFRKHSRMLIDLEDARRIPAEHRGLFRRAAAQGLHDLSVKEWLALD